MSSDDLTHIAIAVVAFLIGVVAGAGWLAEKEGKAIHWPVRVVSAIAGGMRFYISLIFFFAALGAIGLLVKDVFFPDHPTIASDSQPLVPPVH